MGRIFILAYQPCYGETGGGQGVVYRLYEANKKYRLMDDVYFVFGDRIVHGADETGPLAKMQNRDGNRAKKNIARIIPGFIKVRKYEKSYSNLEQYVKQLNEQFSFNCDDRFIFHDLQFARAFVSSFGLKRVLLVIHSQGSFYNEWKATHGYENSCVRKYYEKCFDTITSRLNFLGFPSYGAKESFFDSTPELRKYIDRCTYKILYNGVSCGEFVNEDYTDWISDLKAFEGMVFSTIATLNAAKAVERIPQYLGALKKKGIQFKWVLVGKGGMQEEVDNEIKRANIVNETIWINDYLAHEKILQILSVTDFYILFHKYSIFDLSTLEAMHYGAIPILTPVGGNKEVIIEDNGLFVVDFTDVSALVELVNTDFTFLKKVNQRIQESMFSDKIFLKRYLEVANSL